MANIEISPSAVACCTCGKVFAKRKDAFPVSHAFLHKATGYLPYCKECVAALYQAYFEESKDPRIATRQMCRKLDLYWNDTLYEAAEKQSSARTVFMQYLRRVNGARSSSKSYDDTLREEGTFWKFPDKEHSTDFSPHRKNLSVIYPDEYSDSEETEPIEIDQKTKDFWGPGYSNEMYYELQQRWEYWINRLPEGLTLDVGTTALIQQICATELDINKIRASGGNVDKQVNTLNTLLGSALLKPKADSGDTSLEKTPLGVWLYRYENKRPLPEIDDDLKDVNGIKRYVFTWMGHVCKMLGKKNRYSELYEDELAKYTVQKPEYDGDDEEALYARILTGQEDEAGSDE